MDTIIQQDIAVLPLSEPGIVYVQDRRLRNVRRSRFGDDPDFRHAWIAEKNKESPDAALHAQTHRHRLRSRYGLSPPPLFLPCTLYQAIL
jgi:hypothetical protein